MSWIRTEDNSLVNLDSIEKIEVLGVDKEESKPNSPDYVLLGYIDAFDSDTSIWITSGTEEHCLKVLDSIAKGVHMVKI